MKGLFQVTCPSCGAEVTLSGMGSAWCASCHRQYLVRRGHLIAVPTSLPPEGLAPGNARLR